MELISLHQPDEFGKGQNETPHVRPHPESFSLASILAEQGMHHQEELESEWLAKDDPETNLITIKPETASHVTSSGFPYPDALCRLPFPNKLSSFLSTCVSSDNSFPSVRQEPGFRPWKGSSFLQHLDE